MPAKLRLYLTLLSGGRLKMSQVSVYMVGGGRVDVEIDSREAPSLAEHLRCSRALYGRFSSNAQDEDLVGRSVLIPANRIQMLCWG